MPLHHLGALPESHPEISYPVEHPAYSSSPASLKEQQPSKECMNPRAPSEPTPVVACSSDAWDTIRALLRALPTKADLIAWSMGSHLPPSFASIPVCTPEPITSDAPNEGLHSSVPDTMPLPQVSSPATGDLQCESQLTLLPAIPSLMPAEGDASMPPQPLAVANSHLPAVASSRVIIAPSVSCGLGSDRADRQGPASPDGLPLPQRSTRQHSCPKGDDEVTQNLLLPDSPLLAPTALMLNPFSPWVNHPLPLLPEQKDLVPPIAEPLSSAAYLSPTMQGLSAVQSPSPTPLEPWLYTDSPSRVYEVVKKTYNQQLPATDLPLLQATLQGRGVAVKILPTLSVCNTLQTEKGLGSSLTPTSAWLSVFTDTSEVSGCWDLWYHTLPALQIFSSSLPTVHITSTARLPYSGPGPP